MIKPSAGSFLVACLLAVATLGNAWAGAYDDLFLHIKDDQVPQLRALLARGLDPNTVDEGGEPALVRALREESFKVFDLLMNQPGINLEQANRRGETALMLVAFKGRLDLVKKLIAAGVEVNKTGWAPLHYAAANGHNEIVSLLLEHAAYIDAESPNKTTPIMMAVRGGHILTVKLLLDEGADVSVKNEQGMTAVDFALRHQQKEIAEGLQLRAKRDAERRAKPWK